MAGPAQVARARSFARRITEAGAQHREPVASGALLRSPGEPEAYVGNQLLLDAPGPLNAATLAALLDDLQGGLGHRRAYIDAEDHGRRLHRALSAYGWGGGDELVMGLGDGGVLREPPADVVEASADQLRALERRTNIEMGLSADVGEQLVRIRDRARARLDARGFIALDSDRHAAHATLYSDGRVAQIEDVATTLDHRGRGMASAVVASAARAALARGHELVFLLADGDDWPQQLYEKLGFRTIGRSWVVQREVSAATTGPRRG